MVKLKICGLKRLEDIEYINELKSDYIGFIFAKSKRQIDLELAVILGKNLKKGIKKVGVFVNETPERVAEIKEKAGLDVVQLHGDEDIEYIESLPKDIEVWKAIRVKDERDISSAETYAMHERVSAVLLDAYHEEEYGGMGISFDWSLIKRSLFKTLILAGGLNDENIERAIEKCTPDIVDVSSGVETEGFKDYEKIKRFIEKVRKY